MSLNRQKHVAPRATAEEISRAVGVTETDRRVVRQVLRELGYLPATSGPGKTDRPSEPRLKTGSC
jgi:hypothetical protein